MRLSAVLLLLMSPLLAQAQAPNLPGWSLSFDDEFNAGENLSKTWNLTQQDNSNGEKQYYSAANDSIVSSGGDSFLRITAKKESSHGKSYTSGQLISYFTQAQGKFEARLRLPNDPHLWPAFWLNADALSWPNGGGEVDICEAIGKPNYYSTAYHWNGNPGYLAEYNTLKTDLSKDWHTFGLEWTSNNMKLFRDGVQQWEVDRTKAMSNVAWNSLQNIRLQFAVGGNYPGNPDSSTKFPGYFDVDYVRAWKPSLTASSVPEPSSAVLLVVGLVFLTLLLKA